MMPPHTRSAGAKQRIKSRSLLYLSLLGLFPLFFLGGPDWASGPLLKSVWNLGHILFFALLVLAIRPWRRWSGWRLWLGMTVAVAGLGIGIEALQAGLGRQANWHDALRNLIGAWLVLAWRTTGSSPPTARFPAWSARAVISLLLVSELVTTGVVAARQFQVARQLPLIYDFNHPDPLTYWSGDLQVSQRHTQGADYSLKLSLHTERYSGASLDNLPQDWRGYRWLILTLHNPQDTTLAMTLRINDLQHDRGDNAYDDRFNTRLRLEPGLNTVHVDLHSVATAPRDRNMDMANIRRLVLFTSALDQPATLYLAAARLEREP